MIISCKISTDKCVVRSLWNSRASCFPHLSPLLMQYHWCLLILAIASLISSGFPLRNSAYTHVTGALVCVCIAALQSETAHERQTAANSNYTCVIKTLLHRRFIKTVIEFLLLLVCIVYFELSCVLLWYVSCTNVCVEGISRRWQSG